MFDDLKLYLRIEDIYAATDDYSLYERYAKDFPKPITTSPFRSDRNPSFGYYEKGGRWWWKDQGTGDFGGIFDYIQRANSHLKGLQDVLQYINDDMALNVGAPIQRTETVVRSKYKEDKDRKHMQVIRRKWTQYDLDIWGRWCWNIHLLRLFNMGAATQVWTENKKARSKDEKMQLVWTEKEGNPIYYFHFPHSKHIKAYRPLETDRKRKFLGNVSNLTDVFGYHQAEIKVRRPRLLILTKAGKECGFYRSFGNIAMASQAESTYLDPDFIRHLKKYCGRIISFYDNDKAGIHGAWQLREEHDIEAFFVPRQWGAKNITDLWEINKPKTYQILNYLNEWNSYRAHFRSYHNLLRKELPNDSLFVPDNRLLTP